MDMDGRASFLHSQRTNNVSDSAIPKLDREHRREE